MPTSPRRTRRPFLRTPFVIAGVGIVAVTGLTSLALTTAGSGTGEGTTAVEAWDLPRLGGGEDRLRLADFEGGPLVVNFFASWCTSCDAELPGFRRVSQDLRGEVAFAGIASLETGDPMTMPERHGITWWPLAQDVGGRNGSGLHGALGGRGMPITAFYDSKGALIEVVSGALPEAALRDRLRVLFDVSI